jgi:hypothetical protein
MLSFYGILPRRKSQSMNTITLGYAPTRRSIFSAPDVLKYRNLTKQRLEELGINIVDIDDINGEGLLYDDRDLPRVMAKFRAAGVDGLFFRIATSVPNTWWRTWRGK